ncbi:MAG: hemolysin family protein, partial [Jaaginema sp. PMC 1079.18]|nr:hemolysin family protein [Jaaginema sp. PMC 1079.18]
ILLGSAFCAAAETALLAISPLKVRQLSHSRKPSAIALARIRQRINRPIATIVILNNTFNIVGSIIIGGLASQVFGDAWIGVFSAIFTLLIILFGEIFPKTLGERYAETLALLCAIPVQFLTFVFTPVVWLVEHLTMPFTKGKKLPTTNEAEIRLLASIGYQEGTIEDDEAEMIQRVFQLNDLNAAALMTPRILLTYLYGDRTFAEAKSEIIASTHTRILVIEDSIDRVIGVALKDELLIALIEGNPSQKVSSLMRPVRFVPETIRADRLLKEFQETHKHLVVVLDEYGGVSGVVTLEDVLEVLTGEIVDETDKIIDLQEVARQKRKRLLKATGLEVES